MSALLSRGSVMTDTAHPYVELGQLSARTPGITGCLASRGQQKALLADSSGKRLSSLLRPSASIRVVSKHLSAAGPRGGPHKPSRELAGLGLACLQYLVLSQPCRELKVLNSI